MANQNLTQVIDNGVMVMDDTLLLASNNLINIIKSPSAVGDIHNYNMKFLTFLCDLTGVTFFELPSQFLTIFLNESFDYKLTISYTGFQFLIEEMLNCKNIEKVTYELSISEDGTENTTVPNEMEILNQIKVLGNLKDESEFKEKFPYFYGFYRMQKDEVLKQQTFKMEYMLARKDPSKTKKLMKRYNVSTEKELDEYYNTLKMFSNFDLFKEKSVIFFSKIIEKRKEIINWAVKNPIELRLSEEDMRKVLLFIIWTHMGTLMINAENDNKYAAQTELVILERLFKQYQEKYPNDKTIINVKSSSDFNDYNNHPKQDIEYNIEKALNDFETILSEHTYLKRDANIPMIDKELSRVENIKNIDRYILDLVSETIDEDEKQGAINAEEEVKNKLEQLEEEVESKTLSDKERREKAIVLEKLKMVLNDIEPRAIQTGIGVFKGYYVYYYNSGMVAVDRVDRYGALYIMPVNIYNLAKYKNRLKDVQQIPGVEHVNHKNKDWLNIARGHIMSGTGNLTEQDKKEAELIASIDFPYTAEEIEKLQKQLEEKGNFTEGVAKETKRRLIKIKELEDIDKELTNNEFNNYSDSSEEKRQALEQLDEGQDEALNSDEIDKVIYSDQSFEELYEEWKRNNEVKKQKRNPIVAGITKRRAMIGNNYFCEWCECQPEFSRGVNSHHIIELSKGGPDNIYNTACLCTFCHSYFHSEKVKPLDKYRLFMKTKDHIIEENPEYLPQFNELLNKSFTSEEQERFNEFYTYEWNYFNYNANKKMG